MEPEEETHILSSSELLNLAENHLRLRNYSLSSQYALESLHSTADSTYGYNDNRDLNRRAELIAVVSDILFAASETLGSSYTNWYSVLGVDTFCGDINIIRSKFKSMLLLLNPVKSTFLHAEEALKFTWKAWGVLGNPERKSELDALIKTGFTSERFGAEESENFWTVCPYCYYMYEYARVYEGCCLRCQNDSCRRAFQGVSARSPPPAADGLNQYECFSCFAYFPLGFSHSQGASNGKKFDSWSPFGGMVGLPQDKTGVKRKGLVENVGVVDISDSDESDAPVDYGNGNTEVPGVGSHVFIQRGRDFQTNLTDAVGNGGVNDGGNIFDQNVEDYGFLTDADMQFVEKNGEIFLEMPHGDED